MKLLFFILGYVIIIIIHKSTHKDRILQLTKQKTKLNNTKQVQKQNNTQNQIITSPKSVYGQRKRRAVDNS